MFVGRAARHHLPARLVNRPRRRIVRGVTLLELLVVVALLAVVSALAYGGLLQVQTSAREVDASLAKLRQVQRAVTLFERDVGSAAARPIALGLTRSASAMYGGADNVEFSRDGLANPTGIARSELQRVAYVVEAQNLQRHTWVALDRPVADQAPKVRTVLTDVQSLSFRYLDANGVWRQQWEPDRAVPARAIELQLELGGIGIVRRVIRVPS